MLTIVGSEKYRMIGYLPVCIFQILYNIIHFIILTYLKKKICYAKTQNKKSLVHVKFMIFELKLHSNHQVINYFLEIEDRGQIYMRLEG